MKKLSKKIICIMVGSALVLGAGVTAIILGAKKKKDNYAAVDADLPWEEV